jgi:IS4 transposase
LVEADQAQGARAELLIRAHHDRRLDNGKALRQSLEQAPILGEVTFTSPKTSKRPAREVTQTLQAARVTIQAPRGKATRQRAVTLTALLAQEPSPPKGQEPLHWLLLTTLPVETFEQAVEKLQWYLCRWQIELLFKVLKSGSPRSRRSSSSTSSAWSPRSPSTSSSPGVYSC